MNKEQLVRIAGEQVKRDEERFKAPFFVETIAWFHYLGLLRHNGIEPHRHHPRLRNVLNAGELEPRILELLPAIMTVLPEAVRYTKREIPPDLAKVLGDIRNKQPGTVFRGVPPEKYNHWLKAPAMEIARRRLDFRRAPRKRGDKAGSIGEIIRDGRIKLSLTQEAFAEKYGLSLKVIRDLEQGKLSPSLSSVMAILAALGRTLRA